MPVYILIFSFLFFPSLSEVGDYYASNGEYTKAIGVYKKSLVEDLESDKKIENKLGQIFYETGEYEKAKQYLKKDDKDASAILGKIYFKENDLDKASKYFENSKDIESHYYLGIIAFRNGNMESAIREFRAGNYLYPEGVIYYKMGEYEKAISCFEKVSSFPSEVAQTDFELGACWYKLKKYEPALHYFVKSGENFFQAEILYRLKRFKEAEQCYKNSLKEGHFMKESLYGLAWTYYKLNKWNEAKNEFKKFSELFPEDEFKITSLYYCARANLKLGNFDESISFFRRVVENSPESFYSDDAQYLIGKAYFLMRKYKNAVEELTKLLTQYPKSRFCPYAINMIGDSYYEQKKYREAIHYYKKISSSGLKEDADFKIEKCYYNMGVYKHPLDMLKSFIAKHPDSPKSAEFSLEIADYYYKTNDLKQAISSYEKVIQEFNWSDKVNEARLGLAECFFRLGEYERAIEEYKGLLNTEYAPRARLNIANIYSLIGEYEKSIKEYEILLNEYPTSLYARDACYEIGIAYKKLQRPSGVIIAFSKFIEKYPKDARIWSAYLEVAKAQEEEGELEEYSKILHFVAKEGTEKAKHEAEMLLGSLYFDKQEYETAKGFYLLAKEGYRENNLKAQAALFAAKCAEANYDTGGATTLYSEVKSLTNEYKLTKSAEEGIIRLQHKSADED